jgi:translation initiation factor 2 alpha subunit (eIF-2alpha)
MSENQLEEGQIVQCTVKNIEGTSVFVKIEGNGEGSITTSEISPGRIRNLRDYVFPGKVIVCKVLSIKNGKVFLSLRRVKPNEKKELLDKINKEKGYIAILKTVLGKEKAEKIINEITEKKSILDFFEEAKENRELMKKYFNKEESEKILKILESKKEKSKELKQSFKLLTKKESGIKTIKTILENSCKGSKCNITYLAAGRYLMKIVGDNLKEIQSEINKTTEIIEKEAKKNNCEFAIEKS